MDQLDILLQPFREAVMADAKNECEEILSELNKRYDAQNEKIRDEVLNQTYYYIQSESEKIRSGVAQELSARSVKLSGRLLDQRRQIEDDVFAEVRERVRAFRDTDGYRDFLLALIKKHPELLSEPFTISVAPFDMRFESDIKKLCPLCEVQAADGIKDGGFEALPRGGAFRITETLDARLLKLRSRFSERPELIVT